MFTLAFIIGIYSYLIFFLGIFGFLYKSIIILVTGVYFLLILSLFLRRFAAIKLSCLRSLHTPDSLVGMIITLFLLQAVINLIGALGPELAFDTLWYHLTLPKIYLNHHAILHITGGLLYYSDMPKLTEMLYTAVLSFGNETLAKLIQFAFGILCCIALYKFSRKFFNKTVALIAVIIFYSNLVVAWESMTAYVDLARTFFELLGLWSFVNWVETKKYKWFLVSACMIGLAITTKLLTVGSLGIFGILIIADSFLKKKTIKECLGNIVLYVFVSLLIPLPWFIFSFTHTGNLIYPFFSAIYKVHPGNLFNVENFFVNVWNLFTHAADPVSPVYIMFLPLVLVGVWFPLPQENGRDFLSSEEELLTMSSAESVGVRWRNNNSFILIILYALLSLFIWYITPNTGGGRFILPYLPAYSLLIAFILTYSYSSWFKRTVIGIVIFVAVISIIYRGVAIIKYLPLLFGRETKQKFLTDHLNFSFGDFYDTDNYFKKNIKKSDRVLLYGFHNLYYVDFPFIDNSWVKHGEKYNYIAVQHGTIGSQYENWQLVYQNNKTGVKVYKQKNNKWATY